AIVGLLNTAMERMVNKSIPLRMVLPFTRFSKPAAHKPFTRMQTCLRGASHASVWPSVAVLYLDIEHKIAKMPCLLNRCCWIDVRWTGCRWCLHTISVAKTGSSASRQASEQAL